ncbi:MAG: dihydroorotate dehydrogenase (quinone) [Micrococcales bacterium]|nr:MAG: dihydroorotate dehydrogenase (quinone) [Micrococcales bacterium]
MYPWLFRHVVTRVDAETAHQATLRALVLDQAARQAAWSKAGAGLAGTTLNSAAGVASAGIPAALGQQLWGRDCASPLGLAAGFDKNGRAIDALAGFGFGAVEIGTVTGQAQPGNPRPRLFRLPAEGGIINRMGFNNDGSRAVADTLAHRAAALGAAPAWNRPPLLGINIGKTKSVAPQDAAEDYALSARRLARYADYLVVNVSSPNTPGLRDLQATDQLHPILAAVQAAVEQSGRPVPLCVKISPDLADADIEAVADLAVRLGLSGIIATNTTVRRDGLRTPPERVTAMGDGGLSGPALAERSRQVLRLLRNVTGDRLVLISAGGVRTAADVWHRMCLGASLVQAYTAVIYGGPAWPARINRDLAARVAAEGLTSIQEIVGSAHRTGA